MPKIASVISANHMKAILNAPREHRTASSALQKMMPSYLRANPSFVGELKLVISCSLVSVWIRMGGAVGTPMKVSISISTGIALLLSSVFLPAWKRNGDSLRHPFVSSYRHSESAMGRHWTSSLLFQLGSSCYYLVFSFPLEREMGILRGIPFVGRKTTEIGFPVLIGAR